MSQILMDKIKKLEAQINRLQQATGLAEPQAPRRKKEPPRPTHYEDYMEALRNRGPRKLSRREKALRNQIAPVPPPLRPTTDYGHRAVVERRRDKRKKR
ncbi:hypothetical protein DESC_240065 [Desulfosarcina cetonica]|nr:hypothetical protein DESC_240065 [Desulfosarcina cetonica]